MLVQCNESLLSLYLPEHQQYQAPCNDAIICKLSSLGNALPYLELYHVLEHAHWHPFLLISLFCVLLILFLKPMRCLALMKIHQAFLGIKLIETYLQC
jgi:hypothetical protein